MNRFIFELKVVNKYENFFYVIILLFNILIF